MKDKPIPLGTQVLVLPFPKEEGSIILPNVWGKNYGQFRKGAVEAKGSGNEIYTMDEISAKRRDVVLFPEGSGTTCVVEGITYLLLDFDELIAVI